MPVLVNFEFHRHGIGLVPESGQGQAGSAIHVAYSGKSSRSLRSCTCETSKKKTCRHLITLSQGVDEFGKVFGGKGWDELFTPTPWYQLAHLVFEHDPQAALDVRVSLLEREEARVIRITSARGAELAQYLDPSPAAIRLLERTGKAPHKLGYSDRAGLLERLAMFQASPDERQLNTHGVKTQRQSWEESFWYRLAYHCVREFGFKAGTFHPAIHETSGDFTLTYRVDEQPIVKLTVPRGRVQAALKLLMKAAPGQQDLAIHPVPLRSIFRVTQSTELDLVEVRPVIRALQQTGEERFFERRDLEKFRYGNLVYIKVLGILAELERPGAERKFRAPLEMKLRRSQVPTFLDAWSEAIDEGAMVLEEGLQDLKVFKEIDYVEIDAQALERSWYWLAVEYGIGNQEISLQHILQARAEGLPYLETPSGWIDLSSPAFAHLDRLLAKFPDAQSKGRLRWSASELLRLQADTGKAFRVKGERGSSGPSAIVRQLLELTPSAPLEPLQGFRSVLRPYQKIGVDWLRFLYENQLGGLLCDDMGLGKTHQAMALMASLREQEQIDGPFLVVCPTTVISHWRDKIRDFAPGLSAVIYHGTDRDLEKALAHGDAVLLTSYGILRNDSEVLAEIPFDLAIFDEIQYLKNRETLGYQAALQMNAAVKIGLTGTPIENSLSELRNLFDLILPGYLGTDAEFSERYLRNPDAVAQGARLGELQRILAPFVLRRLKASVLSELPEKIEDLRTCALSDDQIKLYRDVITTRGMALVQRLRTPQEPLPYIHIFALLNHLKQICDHPALALRELDQADKYASGKWDLFREILQECLDSGQKVVVFTQYLGMIQLMERHLRDLGIESVSLTGKSQRRDVIIDRFNQDPLCRVFLGSLKAGGTGIDLVGGSVVIHYDRWWNAAREDQATDRVHRLGQRRVVQVFKLITEGTLEEKIAAIIASKRSLLDAVVEEDEPGLAKVFTREELLAMLQQFEV